MSTKARYGLAALVDLALHEEAGPQPLKDIAKRQHYSDAYLEQLFAALKKAQLVKSIRGAKGGYVLAREPADITVGEVIRTLEGPIVFSACVGGDMDGPCSRIENCPTQSLWQEINDSIDEVINNRTLADLMH